MLLTMKSVCQITCCFEKRPEPSQETSGTMFFKARSKFFFGISKFFLICHKRYPQDDRSKIFFCKKKITKKNANKICRKNLSKKKLIRVHATHYESYVSKYLLF